MAKGINKKSKMNFSLNNFILNQSSTLKDALNKININCEGICFIVDNDQRIIGTLTDGDIRRALLNGSQLEDNVILHANKHYITLPVSSDNGSILKHLNDKIKVIPLIDDESMVVDYATINKIRRIPVANPVLEGNELEYVSQCIKTSWISSQGKFVSQFEEIFSELVGDQNALAVSNGTVALHLALLALGIGEGDEVIVPDLTFAATINAVIYVRATPVLADVDKKTWGLDKNSILSKITPRTKAIIPVHLYGHPCDIIPIKEIAEINKIYIIEDCAEAVGSKYYGKHVGCLADASTFSFFGNKTITTGEGGMVVFKEKDVADRARILRDHGMAKNRRYWHEHIGYNYRLTNVQAAIGVAQSERLEQIVNKKREIAHLYQKYLKKTDGIILPAETDWAYNSFWLYTVLLENITLSRRNRIIEFLNHSGIETRPVFYPLHEMPVYEKYIKANEQFPVSKAISESGLSLPSSLDLNDESIHRISEALIEAIKISQND